MALIVRSIALDLIRALRPLLPMIRKHDRSLANQVRDAASSVALNIGEAEYSDGGNRRARFHTAAGSVNEVGVGLQVAVAFGYVAEPESADALHLVDRILAMLWKLNGAPGR